MFRCLRPLALTLGFCLVLGTVGAAQTSAAQQFTLLIYESDRDLAQRTDASAAGAYWSRFAAFAVEMQQAGVLRGGTALGTGSSVVAVGAASGDRAARRVEPSGYFVIEVANAVEAMRWAKRAPGLATGMVEIRAHQASPAMTP